jgi:hypothetical protein
MRELLAANDVLAYLVMMTARLIELHRVLKPTGSLHLHCDPTASHYLRLMLDASFDCPGQPHWRPGRPPWGPAEAAAAEADKSPPTAPVPTTSTWRYMT